MPLEGEPPSPLVGEGYARIGLLGNPSDGYFGKTLSLSLKQFKATVTLRPNGAADDPSIHIVPHPKHDQITHGTLSDLQGVVQDEGYYGGVRLLLAILKTFKDFCDANGIALAKRGFSLSYDTNVPRQVGLSGSSAIICAALNCLVRHYLCGDGDSHDRKKFTKAVLPGIMLQAEQELGITSGLQDRVIQVYGGAVHMDFDESFMSKHGHGIYTELDVSALPELYLMYYAQNNASESGKVHSTIRERWLRGDGDVASLMKEVAQLADEGRDAIARGTIAGDLGRLMDANFAIRRKLFGDEALGAKNLAMVELAQSVGASAKFTGSGGCIAVYCPSGDAQVQSLKKKCEDAGIILTKAEIAGPNQW